MELKLIMELAGDDLNYAVTSIAFDSVIYSIVLSTIVGYENKILTNVVGVVEYLHNGKTIVYMNKSYMS